MTKALLFDFNGTLIFDAHIVDKGWKILLEPLIHRSITQKELDEVAHGTNASSCLEYFLGKENVTEELIDEIDVIYRKNAKEEFKKGNYHLAPGAEQFLNVLKEKQIPMTIATSSPILNIDLYFELFHLDRWFDRDRLMYNDGSFPGKPSPYIYLEAAKKLECDIHECIVMEDAIAGIQSGKNADAKKVIAITEFNNDETLLEAGADVVIHDYLDIENLLKELEI
ncbi:MAG: HAD family phosphatase [Holdemanella sp.]|nr:HAD family phosphatase [Holdemanella sp.]